MSLLEEKGFFLPKQFQTSTYILAPLYNCIGGDGFICFMFGAVQFLNVLILTLLCVQFVWFSKDG